MADDHKRNYDFGLLFMRITMGGFILLHGITKLQNGLDHFVHGTYASMTPGWLPSFIAVPYGYCVPFAEVILGAMFVLGLFTRKVAIILFLMLLSFTIALASAGHLFRGIVYHQNIIFLAILFFFCVANPGRHTLDPFLRKRIGKKSN